MPSFRNLMSAYIHAFLTQVLVSVACNGANSAQQPLARETGSICDRDWFAEPHCGRRARRWRKVRGLGRLSLQEPCEVCFRLPNRPWLNCQLTSPMCHEWKCVPTIQELRLRFNGR